MLLIPCPYCEQSRPEIEFRYGGEAALTRPAPDAGEEALAAFLFLRKNVKGWHAERWRHVHGCGRFFNALRHTVTDRTAATWKAGAPMPDAARALIEGDAR
jgi:sarcosine oxidase subunit delta